MILEGDSTVAVMIFLSALPIRLRPEKLATPPVASFCFVPCKVVAGVVVGAVRTTFWMD